MSKPKPDEYGRLRVRDEDTGHERTIHAAELAHGNYVVLAGPASDAAGLPIEPVFGAPRVPVETTNRGQQAENLKEKADG